MGQPPYHLSVEVLWACFVPRVRSHDRVLYQKTCTTSLQKLVRQRRGDQPKPPQDLVIKFSFRETPKTYRGMLTSCTGLYMRTSHCIPSSRDRTYPSCVNPMWQPCVVTMTTWERSPITDHCMQQVSSILRMRYLTHSRNTNHNDWDCAHEGNNSSVSAIERAYSQYL